MTWHTVTVASGELCSCVVDIRRHGGLVTSTKRCPDGYVVTWVSCPHGK
ncbi:hypothetical protein FB382_003401 [Nocardioides ginsengisegetis]|uniref:Uncharacterized protein n=1 Tax=Nocardioides ginsengisegetis TaxID=661491 RepID=A0A7W3PAU7_9ACTN|nr:MULTISPECIES: hypothetical protein [Nocardioides]MBA8805110.1 hypothetical protein [Nocardioides ginsengisegetis]GCD89630.1 hypothetical protein NLS1_16360 [Nocardioides sp. LS1]